MEVVGISFTVIVTSETEGPQGGLSMVHLKIFIPTGSAVIIVIGESELVIVPPPEISDHVPTPTVAVFAAIVTDPVVIQIV